MIQANILYSGRVQGVGFRATVHGYASRLKLKGWVKNLTDGRVEVLVEGPEEEINQLCQEIANHFEGFVTDCQKHEEVYTGSFKDFRIRY